MESWRNRCSIKLGKVAQQSPENLHNAYKYDLLYIEVFTCH